VVSAFIGLQNGIGLPTGFPIHCFVIGDHDCENDFFHESDKVSRLSEKTDWEQISVLSGLFPSRNEARKRSFAGKIPNGWHEVTVGKGSNQTFIFILKST